MKIRLIMALLTLAGCATTPPEAGCTALGEGVRYCLQPLPAGQGLAVNQWVEVSVAGRASSEQLVFAIDAAGARMQVVGLSPLGQRTPYSHARWEAGRSETSRSSLLR